MASEKIGKIKQKPFNFTNTEAIPLIKEENQKKRKHMNWSMKKVEWGKNTQLFESIRNAVANISSIHYYDSSRKTRVDFDASDNQLGATLEQQTNNGHRLQSLSHQDT